MKEFGNAKEFYRLRVVSMDYQDVEKFDWNDDILYREPARKEVATITSHKLQVIDILNNNALAEKVYRSEKDARTALECMSDDLEHMTKNEFDAKYIST